MTSFPSFIVRRKVLFSFFSETFLIPTHDEAPTDLAAICPSSATLKWTNRRDSCTGSSHSHRPDVYRYRDSSSPSMRTRDYFSRNTGLDFWLTLDFWIIYMDQSLSRVWPVGVALRLKKTPSPGTCCVSMKWHLPSQTQMFQIFEMHDEFHVDLWASIFRMSTKEIKVPGAWIKNTSGEMFILSENDCVFSFLLATRFCLIYLIITDDWARCWKFSPQRIRWLWKKLFVVELDCLQTREISSSFDSPWYTISTIVSCVN